MMDNQTIIDLLDRMQNEDAKQREEELPSEKRWRSISRDIAEALNLLARIANAKNIVEIGTSHGYSTIWLALAARSQGGKVTTFEIEKWRQEKARSNIEEAGLSDYVEFVLGDMRENKNKLPESIDFVFLDAEKRDYLSHFKELYDKLRPGGTVVADNAISHFADLREYINHVRMNHETSSVLFPLGRGLEVTYKTLENEPGRDLYDSLIR